ncbi:Ubiquitin carboxyl-terminal hydrolase [Dirofilaria immitis]
MNFCFRCLIVFIKRYFFNASVAVKRDDKIRIPLYLTLRKGSAKETAPFLALSPTTKSINFNTAKLLKINLFRDVKKSFIHTSTDAREVRGLSTGTVESNRIGNRELVLKSAIPSPSGSVIPETIYTQRWRHLKASNDVAPNNYPSSFVSHGIIDNKPVMESKMDEDDQLVYPVPISRNNPLDHSQAQLHASTASSGDNINLGSFIEALKRRIMGDHEEGPSISSKSVLDEKCGENTNKTIESSTKDDAKAVLTNLTNLNIAGVSRATAGHGEKVEEVDPSNKVSSAPYKLAGESRTAVSDRRFYDNTGSHGKLNAVTAAQRFMPNQKFTEANQNYIRGLRSKINVFTSDSKSFQPESLLKLEHPTMSREQKLSNPLFTQRQLNQSRFQKPISKDDYTDEDLRFMTEEEQIMAACERSIDDQLRLFRKDNGISARILRKADERLSMRSANEPVNLKSPYSVDVETVDEKEDYSLDKSKKQKDERGPHIPISQKSSSSDINEDYKVDVETVEETEDCSENFGKQGEQSMHKLLGQNSSSFYINEDIKVDVETVEEKEDYSLDKSKKQKGEKNEDVPTSQKLPAPDINEDIRVDVETIEEKDSSEKYKKQKGEQSTDGPLRQKSLFSSINEDFKVDIEIVENERNYSKRYKMPQDESENSQNFNSNDANEMAVYDYKNKIETKEDEINLKTKKMIKTKPEAMLRECGNNTEYDVTENAKGGRGMEEQINIANANSETVQADGQNISGTGSANTSKSSFKSILSNADTNSSFEYSDTNPSLCYAQTNSEHTNSIADKGGARRKMYLKKNRPPTPPELSFRTKHEISYSDRWTSSRCSGPLLNFKQTMVESKTRLKYSEEAPVYLPPNLTYKDEYSTTLTQPVTSLSFKPSIVGKDFKSPVEPLPSEISDSNLENTENMDDDESSNSDISDDLSSTDGKEILEEIGSVPYKPLCCKMRRAICKYIGMDFNIDWMIQSSVQEMDIHDRPSGLVDVGGDCNCLFQSLAYYVAGSKDGYELLRETIIGFEVEHPDEFADIKAMFCVDVWVFNAKRWLCYRPKFVVGKQCKEINIEDYRIGENEGIYLMYEHNQFLPVLTPSNGIFLNKSISVDSSDTDFMQEYYQPEDKKGHGEKAELLYNMTINSDGDTTGPSYRLISVVSHLGQTANSGHYICDVWCNKSNRWLFCDDGSIRPISQEVVQSRSGIGYIYFYLNRELFEGE